MADLITGLEDWVKRGEALAVRVEETSRRMNADAWEVGDWWKDGGRFGERREEEAQRIFGRAFKTIQDYGWIATKFPSARRAPELSWSHHREVAALPPKQADNLLQRASQEKWDRDGLRAEVVKTKQAPQIEHAPTYTWSQDEKARKSIVDGGGTVVVSMHKGTDEGLRGWAMSKGLLVTIDRGTPWGNPFILDEDGTREEVIANYETHYLPFKPSLLRRLPELRGKVLACWCHPDPCHGHVLASKADEA